MELFQKIGIGIIVGGLILAFFFFFFFQKPKKAEKLPEIYFSSPLTKEYCNKLPDKEKDHCLDLIDYDEIAKRNDLEACFNLRTKEVRERCIHGRARALRDPEICLKIKTKWYQKHCLHAVGNLRLDFKVCEEYIPKNEIWEKRECHDRIEASRLLRFGKKEDILKCKGLALEYENLCLENFYQKWFNFECEKVPKEARDYCLFFNAIEKVTKIPNPQICEEIENKGWKHYCLLLAEKGLEAQFIDSDKDRRTDGDEIFYGLDPLNPDSDGDGFEDGKELRIGTNPKDPDNHPSYLKHPISWLKKLF